MTYLCLYSHIQRNNLKTQTLEIYHIYLVLVLRVDEQITIFMINFIDQYLYISESL